MLSILWVYCSNSVNGDIPQEKQVFKRSVAKCFQENIFLTSTPESSGNFRDSLFIFSVMHFELRLLFISSASFLIQYSST